MKIKLFNKKIQPACEYCSLGRSSTVEMILCTKRGIVEKHYHCRHFLYDPLKRNPKVPPSLQQFDYDDFKID